MAPLERLRFDVQSTRGRRYPEALHPYRTEFQRDRDRLIHSRAFRRLENKTQVFPAGLSDHFRNRLTHSLEVAQVARDLSRALGALPREHKHHGTLADLLDSRQNASGIAAFQSPQSIGKILAHQRTAVAQSSATYLQGVGHVCQVEFRMLLTVVHQMGRGRFESRGCVGGEDQ